MVIDIIVVRAIFAIIFVVINSNSFGDCMRNATEKSSNSGQ